MSASRYFCTLLACVIVLRTGAIARVEPAPADKPDTWIEVQTPHFIVASNDSENTARRVANQFEQVRSLYSRALNRGLRLDPGIPIFVFAVKNQKSLSQLIPEYWSQKGHTHPAGLFVPGPEKNYIALRTDVEGEFPYLPIYHEYVHMIINLNYQHFPLWLNEGFADFLGCATLSGKGGKLGQPDSSELYVLQQGKLLPLDVLFKVDHRSPYYNEAEKTSVFYAESWALVHYLMTDPERQKDQSLSKYISLVESGADPVEGATQAFGDLTQLQKTLQSYLTRSSYLEYVVALPAQSEEKGYSVRAISAAEAQGRLGDFDLYRGQLEAAHAKLDEAIRLDPSLPTAQESMGLVLFRQDQRYEAERYFSRAVALDSKSPLAYYYHGMLIMSQGTDPEEKGEARTALEKAVALNPALGSAWSDLGLLYSNDPSMLDKALIAAKRAVDSMPGEPHFQYNLAVVLMRLERFDEARNIARKLQTSGNLNNAASIELLLTNIDQAQQYLAYKKANPTSATAATTNRETGLSGESSAPILRRGARDNANTRKAQDGAVPVPEPPPAPAAARAYSMVGTITDVNCAAAPQVQLTLRAQAIVMRLHSGDLSQVAITFAGANSGMKRPGCAELRGRSARVSYQLVPDKAWDGELTSIQFRDSP
jgi:tetratricopeptide (TPR) repeat protein